jgi:peptide/nickel transport system permease protein
VRRCERGEERDERDDHDGREDPAHAPGGGERGRGGVGLGAAEAARLAGVSRTRLVRRHLLPGAVTPVVVTMSLDVGNLILALAGLSFIGLGAPAPAAELGAMSARGLDYLFGHPWVPIAPAVAVALLALAANLTGDLINRRIDERTNR